MASHHYLQAKAYQSAAERLRAEANALDARAQATLSRAARAKPREVLDQIGELVVRLVETGTAEADAVALVAQERDLAPGAALDLYRRAVQRRRWLARWRRNREIVRLAWEGKTNAEIAELVAPLNQGKALHAVTVSKILTRELKSRGPDLARSFSPLLPIKDQL